MKKFIVYMIILGILEIMLAVYLTEWRNLFWTCVEQRDYNGFLVQLGVFTVVALILCYITSYAQYCGALAALVWRTKLNEKALKMPPQEVENLGQRIQEDCFSYPDLMIRVIFGLGKALVYVIVFSTTLVLSFSWAYLTIICIYAILSTIVANRISIPLISLNYQSQRAEATYRDLLTVSTYDECVGVMYMLAKKTKHLAYFQAFYGQIAVILPIVIAAPAYFSSALTLGGLMQCTGTMSTISENLSYGINSFNVINKLLSCRKRLKEINLV